MQINNTGVNPLLTSPQVRKAQQTQTDSNTLINDQREQTRAQEQATQQSKDQSASQNTRFEVDQQSLVRVEQYNQERSNEKISSKSTTSSSVNGNYDKPSQQNQSAVNSYRSVESIDQRASIQQTFGVDLYA